MTITTPWPVMPVTEPRLRLWQLLSPALPVGAFAWSQGLEQAVDCGWVHDAASAGDWIGGQLEHVLAVTDLPLLARMHAAAVAGDIDRLRSLDDLLLALRESGELRAGERDLGASLSRLLADLQGTGARVDASGTQSFLAAFARAAAAWSITADDALAGYAFAWCENQVTAAVRLVPLGQSEGQRLLMALGERIPALARAAPDVDDDDIGASAPGLAMASARHETQYSRLFRS